MHPSPFDTELIHFSHCSIEKNQTKIIPLFSWQIKTKEAWLITGPNGGGKSAIAAALTKVLDIVPQKEGLYSNVFEDSITVVSFETATALIQEEHARDNSEFIEGGIDPGRTVRTFLQEMMKPIENDNVPEILESNELITLFGIIPILDRGLKYLSTGEIRRCLLCKALLLKPALLILDEPYDGLDIESRSHIEPFIENLILETAQNPLCPTRLLLIMGRYIQIPNTITHVLELTDHHISFSGSRSEYEKMKNTSQIKSNDITLPITAYLHETLIEAQKQRDNFHSMNTNIPILVEMKNVTVEWSSKKVLDNVSWTVRKGEHWHIHGPNGSGKTTLLELITGDNPQVFKNEVYLFGIRRGSGETIWELKEKMGIVSYRLHVEFRSIHDITLENLIISGLHDSIGLYQKCGEEEYRLAHTWLCLAGFKNREKEKFGKLSYGEQRAMLIARAAVKCPPLLILDEPCHSLDNQSRTRILELLEAIAEEGSSTLLHVTHDPTEILACEKYILELHPNSKPMYSIVSL